MSSVSDSAATAISLWTAWHHDDQQAGIAILDSLDADQLRKVIIPLLAWFDQALAVQAEAAGIDAVEWMAELGVEIAQSEEGE